jgi:hypothetical protein
MKFEFDEKTVWLLRNATAAAVEHAKTKADKARLVELSEHVFLRAALQEGMPDMPDTTYSFDFKRKKALP